MKFAGISSPFKGSRVYVTAAQGMPGSKVALEELTSLLFGELHQRGAMTMLMDDLFICADSPEELFENWREV